MRQPSPAAALRFALFLLVLVAASRPAVAGTGRLLSSWRSRPPLVDGEIGAVEWEQAIEVDLGQGVSLRIGNDGGTLYLAVLDAADATLGFSDMLHLHFD